MKTAALLLLFCIPGAACALAQDAATFEFRLAPGEPLKRVIIDLDASAAPDTVANFEKLVRHRFYNGIKVHRIIPHTFVQMGDPLSRHGDRANVGTGGPGYTLAQEIHLKHTSGAVAMARLPDAINPTRRSNGSQFYICLQPMPNLDGQYTVFGHVAQGMDVLEAISTQAADTNDNPVSPVIIRAAYLGSTPRTPLIDKIPHPRKLWPF